MDGPRRQRRWLWAPHSPVGYVVLWIVSVAAVALVGALGYILIEGWNFGDAIYMSVLTLTTVGFKELHALSGAGRAWTMLLSVTAIGIIFGTVGVVAENLMSAATSGKREARRMQKRIDALTGHFIVCGFGRVGSQVAWELAEQGNDVVITDAGHEDSLERAVESGYLVVKGNGASDEVLRSAGVERARGLVAAIDSDPENVYVTLTARALNPRLFIVARATSDDVLAKLRQAGADRAVSPYTMAGHRIAGLALRPAVVDFIDAALNRVDLGFSIEELGVMPGRLAGSTVSEARARGLFVLAIRHSDGRYEPNPADGRRLEVGQSLIVSGTIEALRAVDGAR